MFGLGAGGSYVATARKAIEKARGGTWRTINDVAYTDGKITVVHVEHFASPGCEYSELAWAESAPEIAAWHHGTRRCRKSAFALALIVNARNVFNKFEGK